MLSAIFFTFKTFKSLAELAYVMGFLHGKKKRKR